MPSDNAILSIDCAYPVSILNNSVPVIPNNKNIILTKINVLSKFNISQN